MTTPVKGYAGASEWQIGGLLDKGSQTATPITAGASVTQDIVVAGDNELTVGVDMTAGATGDLVVTVVPLNPAGSPMTAITIPPTYSNGPTMGTGVAQYVATYDVSGYQRVRIYVKNNSAGPQTINSLWWQLSPN